MRSHPAVASKSMKQYRPDYRQPNSKNFSLATKTSPEKITDVWQRIREGFAISDYENLEPETQRQLKWYLSHQDYFGRVVERARPYLYHIVNEADRRGMPLEVALLPVVESGFKPYALSKSQAAGLWQFIPATGDVFGLEQNWWYDGRRDVIESTRAALDYLQKLYNDFGDWELALAAYNCGEGTVGRAVKANLERGKPIDFWSLDLPAETSAYVPKLLAVSHLVKFNDDYDFALSPINNKPYLDIVQIGSQIDLAKAAEMAGMTEDELYHLNPAFNQWATPPAGPHRLVIPLAKSRQFQTALAAIPPNQRVQWARHEIQRGESLHILANRYHTTVPVIKQANKMESNQLQAGGHLLIPVASTAVSNYAVNATKQRPHTRSVYTVKPGDTWWNIAKANQVNIKALTDWNKKTSSDVLKPGQKLVLMKAAPSLSRKSVNYTIKSGDSLWAISRKFNVSVAQVREWNGLGNRSTLQPGQSIKLYLEET